MLLRRHKRPASVGSELAYFYGNLAPWSLMLYCFSNWFWVYRLSKGGHNTPSALAFFIILASLVFPFRGWMYWCMRQEDSQEGT